MKEEPEFFLCSPRGLRLLVCSLKDTNKPFLSPVVGNCVTAVQRPSFLPRDCVLHWQELAGDDIIQCLPLLTVWRKS